jgi:hypothetical protein
VNAQEQSTDAGVRSHRPTARERLLLWGASGLADDELLSVLFAEPRLCRA